MLSSDPFRPSIPLKIAVVGTGISGLAAAWLLSQRHEVTVYEAEARIGGHSHTVDIEAAGRRIAVDTGFIVYNELCYPNLTALFARLGVETVASNMSFTASLERGRFEYCADTLMSLAAQPSNLLRRRFWSMLSEIPRFYRQAVRDLPELGDQTLDDYLFQRRYSRAFRDDHLFPMAAAIWSTPAAEVGGYPAAAFIRFFANHGLLRLTGRPQWRTVVGGSREYVRRLSEPFAQSVLTSRPVSAILRHGRGADVVDARGGRRTFDHVVLATHADVALSLLAEPSADERRWLGAFRYSRNETFLHGDPALMPRRRRAWGAWNYLSETEGGERRSSVSYWMNRLQPLGEAPDVFVTLNPPRPPRADAVHARFIYEHPTFDAEALAAQRQLWSLQGVDRVWYCGAHFGAGFHEDGLQAGLAVAEELGGVARPWAVAEDSARIFRCSDAKPFRFLEAAE